MNPFMPLPSQTPDEVKVILAALGVALALPLLAFVIDLVKGML